MGRSEASRQAASDRGKQHAALVRRLAERLSAAYEVVSQYFPHLRDAGLVDRLSGPRPRVRAVNEARALLIARGAIELKGTLEHGAGRLEVGFLVPEAWLPLERRHRLGSEQRTVDAAAWKKPAPLPLPLPPPPAPKPAPPPPPPPPPSFDGLAPDARAGAVKIMLWAIRKVGSISVAREALNRAAVSIETKTVPVTHQ